MIGFGLDLPTREVFVVYENGEKKSVAFQDTFNKQDAEYFKKNWEHKGRIVAVKWYDGKQLLKEFKFEK